MTDDPQKSDESALSLRPLGEPVDPAIVLKRRWSPDGRGTWKRANVRRWIAYALLVLIGTLHLLGAIVWAKTSTTHDLKELSSFLAPLLTLSTAVVTFYFSQQNNKKKKKKRRR